MSHVPEVPHPPSSLSFDTVEALESWLQNPEPREPDPRLSIATLVVSPEALKVVLDHARRLSAVRELYIDSPGLEKPEQSLPAVPPKTTPIEAVAATERRSSSPDLRRLGGNAEIPSCMTADANRRRSSVSECKTVSDAVSLAPSTDNISPPSTAPNGVVAILRYHSAKAQGGGHSSSPRGSEDSIEGESTTIFPLLDIVHGDLGAVGMLCGHRKGRIREPLIRLPPRALVETTTRERFKLILLMLAPAKLIVELHDKPGECKGLLTVFVGINLAQRSRFAHPFLGRNHEEPPL